MTMAPGRIRRFLSRLVSRSQTVSRLGRVFRRRRSSEQDSGRIQQCSDHDDTHSSEMPWCSPTSSHETTILTQDSTQIQIQPGETPVVSQLLSRVEAEQTICVEPHEEVGDRCSSFCVCGDYYLKREVEANNEVVGIIPPRVQKSYWVQESSIDEDGYLGDGDSDLNGLEERIPPDGEDQPPPLGDWFPSKKETSLSPKQQDDNLFCPQQLPRMKKPLSSEVHRLPHNLQYSNLPSLRQHLESQKPMYLGDKLQVLNDKSILPKDHYSLGLSSIPSPPHPRPHEKSETPSRKRRHQLASSSPENWFERPSHDQRRRSKGGKNCSTKPGKKCRLQRKKKKKRCQGKQTINHGNSSGKGKTPSFASKPHRQSHAQSHTTKGCSNACIGHVTKEKKHSQPRDGSSSSSGSGSNESSESENGSSRSSSDSKNYQSKRARARKRKRNQKSPDNHKEEKEKSSDSDSSGEFEIAPEEEEGTASKHNESQDPKVVFVGGNDMEQHLGSGDKSPDRRSLNSFTSEDTISKQPTSQIQDHPKSTPAQLDNTLPTQGLQLSEVIVEASLDLDETPSQQATTESAAAQVPSSKATPEVVVNQPTLALIIPEVKAPPQPDPEAENKHSKTKSTSQASQSKPLVGGSDLRPVCNPFTWQAGEEHITLPQSRTMTLGACAQLACSGIMPIRIHCGHPPCIQVEEVLEACAVGDLTLLLNAVKILGTMLYCKLSFMQCGQPLASVIPAVTVDCWEEHEWSLVIDIDAATCDAETFKSFVTKIVRLISNLLEKWQAFHSTENRPPQLISLLKCLRSTIEETLLSESDEPGDEPLHLLNYLVFELLTPLCEQ